MTDRELLQLARSARGNAYAPYSGYRVGAALLCRNGRVYTGCNVECASYGGTVCAERTALCKAVSEGERDFEALAVAGGTGEAAEARCTPCGICRQLLAELCTQELRVICGEDVQYTLEQLLPAAFSGQDMGI